MEIAPVSALEILGYVAAVAMGFSLGLIGGGGSILTVPILFYLFRQDPLVATRDSLFIVGATSLVGATRKFWAGQVDMKVGLGFAIPSLIGVLGVRQFILPNIPVEVSHWPFTLTKAVLVMIAFSILMLAASLAMIRRRDVTDDPSRRARPVSVALKGVAVGSVTGFVGAGGGFLIIPSLTLLLGMPMRIAIGTSLTIIAINSLLGYLVSVLKTPVESFTLPVLVSVLGIGGLFIGQSVSGLVSERSLKTGFGYFVLIVGSFMLLEQIFRLF